MDFGLPKLLVFNAGGTFENKVDSGGEGANYKSGSKTVAGIIGSRLISLERASLDSTNTYGVTLPEM